MHHGEIIKLAMMINEDDLAQDTQNAGMKVNGHLMHSFKDENGEQRWAFYSESASRRLPMSLKEIVIGKKRTAKESTLGPPESIEDDAILFKHIRDYAFTEQKGGSKGEQADYILQEIVNE